MKILYLTDQTYLHGGIEKVLSQKTNYLAEITGEEVVILTHSQQGKKPVYSFSEKIRMIDLDINYQTGTSYFHPTNLQKLMKHRTKLKEMLGAINPDIVVSSSFGPDYYFIPELCGTVPSVKEYHTTAHFRKKSSGVKDRILEYFTKRADRQYSKRILLNEDELKFYSGKNLAVIPNPTELDNRTCSLIPKKIIAAGRISYQKNFEDLVTAFKLLEAYFPDWEVHVYGEDYLARQAEIQKMIDHKGLTGRFVFKWVTADLKETFLGYSIYAMTSVHETFPMVLLEALSVGLPVVSYDCPTGPSRIISDKEDGFLVPYLNSSIFAEKLKKLMASEDLRKQMGGVAKINAERFEISKVMAQWKDLFDNLITQP